MSNSKQMLSIIEKANEMITEESWIQGSMFAVGVKGTCIIPISYQAARELCGNSNLCMCVTGALMLSSELILPPDQFPLNTELFDIIKDYINNFDKPKNQQYDSIPQWNDSRDTTLTDIKNVFTSAIERIKANVLATSSEI